MPGFFARASSSRTAARKYRAFTTVFWYGPSLTVVDGIEGSGPYSSGPVQFGGVRGLAKMSFCHTPCSPLPRPVSKRGVTQYWGTAGGLVKNDSLSRFP